MGSLFFISTFLSSVSPTYLWIRHAFWDLPCLQGFHQEISPRTFGQHSLSHSLPLPRLPLPHPHPLPLPFPLPLPPTGFQHSTSWKNFSIMGGHYIYICIYIHHSSHANHENLYAEQQELGKRLVPHGFHQLGVFLQWISPSYLLIQHRVWRLVFNLDFSIFSIPEAIGWFGIDSGIDFWIWTFLSSVSPTYLWILHRFWDWFVNLDSSIFSIPHLFVDSAWILGFSFLIWTFLSSVSPTYLWILRGLAFSPGILIDARIYSESTNRWGILKIEKSKLKTKCQTLCWISKYSL